MSEVKFVTHGRLSTSSLSHVFSLSKDNYIHVPNSYFPVIYMINVPSEADGRVLLITNYTKSSTD
jgi:hypothetical protein